MDIFVRREAYRGTVQSAVLDWAGTAVDHGCMGPAAVFVDVFADRGVDVTVEDARRFMGLAKKDHIREMCRLPGVRQKWQQANGRKPDENDVDTLYEKTFEMMVDTLVRHSEPITGVVETVREMRAMGIRIGSSTGYVKEMVDVLVPIAKDRGYHPDAVVCSSDVPAGRPYPWMCFENAIRLGTYPMEAMVKIGDTVADIEEGLNSGMWTVGITRTGNELGLTEDQAAALPREEMTKRLSAITEKFQKAGAHYVLDRTADVIPVIQEINRRLADGDVPLNC